MKNSLHQYSLGLALAAALTGLNSCSLVRDDLKPCPHAVTEIRFIYDYNMEFANAFHNQVDCLSVYFFDSNGELMWIETIDDPETLADEGFRLYPELEDGDYKIVAYGGMDCERASFYRVGNFPEGTHYTNLRVQLDPTTYTSWDNSRLHNHYYGTVDFSIKNLEDQQVVVPMMRNTNSIQVVLQNENGQEMIDHNDFIFEITDDNNDFSHDNSLIPTGEITYKPWLKENRGTQEEESDGGRAGETHFHAAVAQFTTSRLMHTKGTGKITPTTLTVKKSKDSEVVLSVPLVNYMLMFKHDNSGAGADFMDDQEFLDRENTWNFVFFLQDGFWLQSHFIINDWEVRMNNADF